MASEGFEWFTRHLFLLSVGGRHALIGILNREVNSRSESLAEILLQNRDAFNSLSRDRLQRLFPTNVTVNDDIATWDLLLLISVVMELFEKSMSSNERFAITMLMSLRKTIKKRPNEICLLEADYDIRRTDLNNALMELIDNLELDGQQEVKSDINISGATNFDLESAFYQIRELGEFPDDFLTPLRERLHEVYPGCTGTRQRLDYMEKSWTMVHREGHEPATTDEDSSLSFTMIGSSENESNNVGGDETQVKGLVHLNEAEKADVTAHEEEEVQPSPLNGTGTTSDTEPEREETEPAALPLNDNGTSNITEPEREETEPAALPLNDTGTSNITDSSNLEPEQRFPIGGGAPTNLPTNLQMFLPRAELFGTPHYEDTPNIPEGALNSVAEPAHEPDDIRYDDLGVVLIGTPHNEDTPNIPEGDVSTYPPLSRDDQIRLNNVNDQLRELNTLTSGVHNRSARLHTLILQINIKSDTARHAAQANTSVVMAINQIITEIDLLPLVRSSEAQQESPLAIEHNERNANLLGTENNEGNMERNTEQRILGVFTRRGELFQLIESILPLLLELLRLGGIPMSAEEGSVLFEIRCISYLAVTNLLQFITSERLQSILNDIAMVWERQTGHKVKLSPLISEESLRSLERFTAEEFNKLPTSRNMHLHLKHGGILYLKRLSEFLQSRSAEEVLNKIAEALANLHGGTYSISVNFEHHRQALDMVDTRAWHLAQSFQF